MPMEIQVIRNEKEKISIGEICAPHNYHKRSRQNRVRTCLGMAMRCQKGDSSRLEIVVYTWKYYLLKE